MSKIDFYKNLQKLENIHRILVIIAFIIIFIIISPSIANIIIGKKLMQFVALIMCLFLAPFIILQPIKGLIFLPMFSYIVPAELQYSGISMGFAISAITMSSALIYILSGKRIPRFSWMWILIVMMLIFKIYFSSNSFDQVMTFIQGIAPFIIFSLIINKESEGRMVLKYWLLFFAIFAATHILRGGVLFPDDSIIKSLSYIRSGELGGYNPNTLGWLCLLYAAICPTIALAEKDSKKRRMWWILFSFIVLLIIFSFSKAAMAGLTLTFILLVTLLRIKSKNFSVIMIPAIISLLTLYVVWTSAVDTGIMDKGRTISVSSMTPQLNKRTQMVLAGWLMFFEYPWGYGAKNAIATHSGFTKAALEYGVLYFILFCIPFLYLTRVSYVISKNHNDISIRMLSTGIFSASIVAVIQCIFGITMFAAEYAQVFWLFVGYMELVNSEFKKSNQRPFLL